MYSLESATCGNDSLNTSNKVFTSKKQRQLCYIHPWHVHMYFFFFLLFKSMQSLLKSAKFLSEDWSVRFDKNRCGCVAPKYQEMRVEKILLYFLGKYRKTYLSLLLFFITTLSLQIIAFDELKTDYKNPIDQCNSLNPVSVANLPRTDMCLALPSVHHI